VITFPLFFDDSTIRSATAAIGSATRIRGPPQDYPQILVKSNSTPKPGSQSSVIASAVERRLTRSR
jgi:hypothetical protein